MDLTFRFPPISESQLDNGLSVLWVPHRQQPAIEIALQMPVGRFSDPVGREGTAELAVALMQKGSLAVGPEQFAERMEHAGTAPFGDVSDEHTVIGCRMLSKYADMIIPLFWDMVCNPGFDTGEFGRLKKEMVTSTQAESVDPGLLVDKHFYAQLFGKSHPAGRTHTIGSLGKIRLDDVRRFHGENLGTNGATLVVVGNFEEQTARGAWEKLFGSWRKTAARKQVAVPGVPAMNDTRIRLVRKDDLSQTTIMVGHHAPGELSKQRNALALANYVLGGGNFSSRLVASVRSATGRTYGINSQVHCNRDFGTFTISTCTQNAQVGEVLGTILDVYNTYSREGIAQEELDRARRFALGSMAFQLEGIGSITDKLLWLRLYGRDLSYVEGYGDFLKRIDRDTVNAAIGEYLSSSRFVVAAVGKRREVVPQLRRFGPVKVVGERSAP